MVRRHIVAMVLVSLVLALTLIALAASALVIADHEVDHVAGAKGRLEALQDLDGATGRYGRQIAGQLLFADDRGDQLQTTRNAMDRELANLTRATRSEINSPMSAVELQSELPELEYVRRMIDLYHVIDQAAPSTATVIW